MVSIILLFIFLRVLSEELPIYSHFEVENSNGFSQTFDLTSQKSKQNVAQNVEFIQFAEGMRVGHDCSYDDQNHFTFEILPFNLDEIHVCRYKCYERTDCTHFVWTSGTCILKKNMPNWVKPFRKKGTLCGYRSKKFAWLSNSNRMVFTDNCHFLGHDYSANISTLEECGDLCHDDDSCTSFSWDKERNCVLKNGPAAQEIAVYKKDASCGFKPQWLRDKKFPSILWHHGCEFDADYNNSLKATPEQCRFACQMSSCTHFLWTTQDGGSCHSMVSNYTGLPISQHDSIICGYKTPNPADVSLRFNATSQSNTDWESGENGIWWSNGCIYFSTFEFTKILSFPLEASKNFSCGELCASTQNCTHFNWSVRENGTCILRNGNQQYPSRASRNHLCGFVDKNYTGGRIHFVE